MGHLLSQVKDVRLCQHRLHDKPFHTSSLPSPSAHFIKTSHTRINPSDMRPNGVVHIRRIHFGGQSGWCEGNSGKTGMRVTAGCCTSTISSIFSTAFCFSMIAHDETIPICKFFFDFFRPRITFFYRFSEKIRSQFQRRGSLRGQKRFKILSDVLHLRSLATKIKPM